MVIIDGQAEEIAGLSTRSWRDDARLRLSGEDMRRRTTKWVRSIVLHTTKGIPRTLNDELQQVIRPGLGPSTDLDNRIARLWSTDGRNAGAHLAVDHDGAVSCHADLKLDAAYHAGVANNVSIGIEIYQGGGGELYVGQLEAVVALVDWLTRRFRIQRQIPNAYAGALPRFATSADDYVGVLGHRDISEDRGPGDPGEAIFRMLGTASYERFNVGGRGDRVTWRVRQQDLDFAFDDVDGIPGPGTVAELAARGRPHGLWIARPGD
jgi:hypothetical protein